MSHVSGAAAAFVAAAKTRDYLLNPTHPDGHDKAVLFASFGFRRENWQMLATALARHPVDNPVFKRVTSDFGMKYVVRCNIVSPDGRNPCIQSVWMVDNGAAIPRLISAYGSET